MKNKLLFLEPKELRKKAEELLKKKKANPDLQLSKSNMLKLIHELDVHTIELELQNEELKRKQGLQKLIEELEANRVELKLKNEKLQQAKADAIFAEKKYHNLYDYAPSGYLTLSKFGDIVELNLTSAKIIGKKREKLINNRFSLFVTSDTQSLFNQFFKKVFQSKKEETCEVTLVNESKEKLHIWLTGICCKNPDRCNVNMIDVTKRKLAEEEIEVLTRRLQLATESAKIGIWELNIKNNILLWDEQMYKLYGVKPDDFGGAYEAWKECVHPDDLIKSDAEVQDAIEGRKNFHTQFRIIWPNGQVRFIEAYATVQLDDDGTPNYMTGVNWDISESKQKEAEIIIAKEHALESDRLKSAFLANMSHEIRTPMNGILGFANLLKETDLDSDKQLKYISIIKRSGKRMLNIINDIIDISKIEAGLMELDITETNINEQLEYIYTFFKHEVEAKGLELVLNYSIRPKEAIIKTDCEKLLAILTNLVKNAIKYSDKGSIEMGCMKKGDSLEFFVKDTGIGIPKERQLSVFERFIQADITDKRAFQGAGLGLAITKAYVDMLGGNIWFKSEQGMGSEFYFTIPYKPSLKELESQLEKPEIVVPLWKENLKILIAEDDVTSELLLRAYIDDYTDYIIVVDNGVDAVLACRNNPDIDLVLMDIKMPIMSGYEAVHHIRKFNKNVIIIAQTAYGLTGDKEEALAAGCNDYISKPFDKEQLLGIINKYF